MSSPNPFSSFFILIVSFSLVIFLTCCDQIKISNSISEPEEGEIIAEVGNSKLFLRDLNGLMTKDRDSNDVISSYVKSWVKKQLVINKALENIEINEAEIERKLLDYRYALIVHEYQKIYIKNKLNEQVDEEEISAYYKEKIENFTLKQTIVRCLFTKLPKEAPHRSTVINQFKNYSQNELEEIKSYCFRFADKSYLDPDLWLPFDEVIMNTPLVAIHNKVQFLKNDDYIEEKDEKFTYLLKILEYRFPDQVSPLESVKEDIKNIIISKRKVQLKQDLEDKIFEEGKINEEFEIYK